MIAFPTTKVTVQRPSGTFDSYAGTYSGGLTTVLTGVLASIDEAPVNTEQPASNTPRSLRRSTCRVNGGTDVQQDDLLTDERTGTIWRVVNVFEPQFVVFAQDRTMEIERTGSSPR